MIAKLGFRGGFTLIELMVVLVVMAVIAAVARPAYESVLPGLEMSRATREMASALRAARMAALTEGRETNIVFDTSARVYWLHREEAARGFPGDAAVSVITSKSEIDEAGRTRIRFFADGASTGGRVVLVRGGASRALNVSWLTGHVAIEQ